jgi:hypothetical protein
MRLGAVIGLTALLVSLVAGCQTAPEQIKIPPLPAEGQAVGYADVVQRARALATSATEAFYIDKWGDVESAALGLEQTALYLPKATDVPPARRASLDAQLQSLIRESQELREAARKSDEKRTNATLQRIHLLVRELRPE